MWNVDSYQGAEVFRMVGASSARYLRPKKNNPSYAGFCVITVSNRTSEQVRKAPQSQD
jgi:hypothetical protein